MSAKKLLVAGVAIVLTKVITDELAKDAHLSDGAKEVVGWGVSLAVGKAVHAAL